ncbi:unnamed protein product [Auanema sp. JU1783]|nr:unnamed protein product [Auanema sp. JU1783]
MKLVWAVLSSLQVIVLGSVLTCYDSELRTYVTANRKGSFCKISFNFELIDCTSFHDDSEYRISAGLVDASKNTLISVITQKESDTSIPFCTIYHGLMECYCSLHGCNLDHKPFLNISLATTESDRIGLNCIIERCSAGKCLMPKPLSFEENDKKEEKR